MPYYLAERQRRSTVYQHQVDSRIGKVHPKKRELNKYGGLYQAQADARRQKAPQAWWAAAKSQHAFAHAKALDAARVKYAALLRKRMRPRRLLVLSDTFRQTPLDVPRFHKASLDKWG